jgi:tRNA modification GTPase
MTQYEDIIIALSTPPGVGAIGVIRLSGKGSVALVNKFFKGKNLAEQPSHTAHFGSIIDEKRMPLDECLVTIFKAPTSYTKEDVVEISCHGSSYIIEQIIRLFLRNGARSANPGEYTLRAFLNGQLDLAQAEAVADLIASDSASTHDIAMKQMRGGFSNEIKRLRQELIDFAALIELELDFGEEDVEFADRGRLENLVSEIKDVIQKLIDSFQLGNIIKQGVMTVIAGRPNAGKSTLLNALLNEERAIVSSIAGTTRDTIEEVLNINGIQFRIIDTAGIREAQDAIEKIGVEKAMEKIAQSALVLFIFDVTHTKPEHLWQDVDLFLKNNEGIIEKNKTIFIANKMDKYPSLNFEEFYKEGLISKENLITASALNKMNIDYIKEKLYDAVVDEESLSDNTIVTNTRHYDALYKTNEALQEVLDGLYNGTSGDFIAMDIRRSLHYLGEIVGEISSEDLLDSIFSRFCIGK